MPGEGVGSQKLAIKHISLRNFRTYLKLDLALEGNLVFFTGPNGIGKTTILEALNMASVLRSFRDGTEKDMIKWDHPHFTIDIEYSGPNGSHQVHIGYGRPADGSPNQRSLKIDGNKVDRISKFIGRFQTVVFSPDDIDIIDTTPQERRRFVDMLLSTLYPSYLESLQEYRRILKSRSEFLKKSKDTAYLSAIDKELAKSGYHIYNMREKFLGEFQHPFSKYIQLISGGKDDWLISYRPSIKSPSNEEDYFNDLKKAWPNDFRLRQTTKGIHRDRYLFHPGERESLDLQQVASQGQKRTVALALKMAQFDYTRAVTHETPILLIDDVLNELDVHRRTSFIEFLNEIGQALITTTDLAGIEEYVKQSRDAFKIEAFEVHQEMNNSLKLHRLEI